jgi:hypothetical protein
MNRKTSDTKAAENYFNNDERDKNTDFTEVLGMSDTLKTMNEEFEKNPDATMINFNKKIEHMLEYRRNFYYQDIANALSLSYVDLNVFNYFYLSEKCNAILPNFLYRY